MKGIYIVLAICLVGPLSAAFVINTAPAKVSSVSNPCPLGWRVTGHRVSSNNEQQKVCSNGRISKNVRVGY